MVLETVDGKLARCTITSSWWGNVFDHGIDLVHPPFWWWAWGMGLIPYGLPLEPAIFWGVMAVIVGGYVVQRLIEGRSEEHTSELQSLMRISYAVFCLKKKQDNYQIL